MYNAVMSRPGGIFRKPIHVHSMVKSSKGITYSNRYVRDSEPPAIRKYSPFKLSFGVSDLTVKRDLAIAMDYFYLILDSNQKFRTQDQHINALYAIKMPRIVITSTFRAQFVLPIPISKHQQTY
ncbi:hypothetical protein J6590_059030 [Homalodisca vitripennis]|nr:hypothetical protein J6590_059030 [Homalodisca vitripennis]